MTDLVFFYGTLMTGFKRPGRSRIDPKLTAVGRGSIHATLVFQGRSAHSARPWQGDNAIHKAGALLLYLQSLAPRDVDFGELTYREVMSVTRIEGFTGRNVVPARCEMNLNFRFAPGRSADAAAAEVQELAKRFGAECAVTDKAPSGPVILDNPLLQELRAITAAPVEAKQAWTDVAQLGAMGIPAANFGPGEQAQAQQTVAMDFWPTYIVDGDSSWKQKFQMNWQKDMRARLFRERLPAAYGILTDPDPPVSWRPPAPPTTRATTS